MKELRLWGCGFNFKPRNSGREFIQFKITLTKKKKKVGGDEPCNSELCQQNSSN